MKYITVVIEYEDDVCQPAFCAEMPLLDGVVVAVQFNDALKEQEE